MNVPYWRSRWAKTSCVYFDTLARARSRVEIESVKAIADLLKERDALRQEVER